MYETIEVQMKRNLLILLNALIYSAVTILFAPESMFWAVLVAALLIWISVADTMTFEIPDLASILLVVSGFIWLYEVKQGPWLDHIVGATVWPALVLGVGLGYARLRGFTGLGFGDVKLLVGLGLWVGFQGMIWVVLTASIAGMLLLLMLAVARRYSLRELGTSAIAFGPFLCFSGWVVILMEGTI